MFSETSEVIRVAALILAILLPAIGVFWQYARETRKALQPPASVVALSTAQGALINETNARLIADAVTDGLKCLCDKLDEHAACIREEEKRERTFRAELLDHVSRTRSAMEAIGEIIEAREARERRERLGGQIGQGPQS